MDNEEVITTSEEVSTVSEKTTASVEEEITPENAEEMEATNVPPEEIADEDKEDTE